LTDQQRLGLYALWLEDAEPAVSANALICLINQTNFPLNQQIAAVEKQFTQQGGYSEQLVAARLAEREKKETFSKINHLRRIQRTKFQIAQKVARQWSCTRSSAKRIWANSSGAAVHIRIVKGLWKSDHV
jgi:four helix bundle suffix protein